MKFSTFAVITDDGEWHEVGNMGWWGMSNETADEERSWHENFWEMFLEGLEPETLVTIADCHI
jgi:hypothetical protein